MRIGTLQQSDVGRKIIITKGQYKDETGILKTWNPLYVFVVIGKQKKGLTLREMPSIAIEPKYIDFIMDEEPAKKK